MSLVLKEATILLEGSQDAAERASILANLLSKLNVLATIYRTDPAAFMTFTLRAGAIRGMATQLSKWERVVKTRAKEQEAENAKKAQTQADHELASLDALTEELKVAGLMAPMNYRVDESGIWDRDERIALDPVVITGVTRDLDTDALRWDLAWKWRGRWWKRSVERDVALDARRLQRMAEFGMPIHSDNATQVIRYLAALESTNLPLIKERATTSRMGWLGARTFQLGEHCIHRAGTGTVLVADGGLADLAKGWKVSGSWDEWTEVIHTELRDRYLVQLAIYAAAVAPLLTILDLDGFIVDWSGATSRGKTSALRVAASVWGDPDKLIGSWGTASVVGPQESAAFLHSLPLILDDTKQVGDRSDIVARMLYDIPGGRERTRGQAGGGLRKVKTWRTVLLSTGEKAVTDFSEDAGARARSLCIRGAPFGSDNDKNRRSTENLTATVRANHGHLGRRLMEHLILRVNFDGLREDYEELRDYWAQEAMGSVSRRLAEKVAALHLAAKLVHDLGCPGEGQMKETLNVAWEAAQRSGADSDRPKAAWLSLYNWCSANMDRFEGARRTNRAEGPNQGWAGYWNVSHNGGGWTRLAIYPQLCRELLDRWGYDRDYCLNEWERRGWLNGEKGRKTRKIKMLNAYPRLLVFDHPAVAEVLKS